MQRLALILAGLALLAPAPLAAAPGAADTYFAARDAYVEKFREVEKGDVSDADVAEHNKALADLTKLIAPVVGRLSLKGYGPAKINLDTLFPSDLGFGMLDGLTVASADGRATVLATTDVLLNRWLADASDLPHDPAEALRSEEFYARATGPDAAVLRYALVPVLPPAGASTARAMLVLRAQDIAPGVPDEMLVAVINGKRVFIASSPVKAKVTALAACDAVWKGYQEKMDAALAAYDRSDPKDEKLFEAYTALQDEADREFRACYAREALNAPFFPDLMKQAQAIANTLPR